MRLIPPEAPEESTSVPADGCRSLFALPASLTILFALSLIVPLVASLVLPWPWSRPVPARWLEGYVYWLGPLLLAGSLIMRRPFVLPAFGLQCLALAGLALTHRAGEDRLLIWMEWLSIGLMVLLGGAFLNRDVLFPYLSGARHVWRRAPRLDVHKMVLLRDPVTGSHCHIVVADASAAGLGIFGSHHRLVDEMGPMKPGRAFEIMVGGIDEGRSLGAELMWTRVEGKSLACGFAIKDRGHMAELMDSFSLARKGKWLSFWLARKWTHTGFRVAFLVLWFMAVVGAYVFPGLGIFGFVRAQ